MATIVGLYSGGTTGLRDGTLLSSADAETAAYAFAALDMSYTLHFRVIDSATGLDPAIDSLAALVFTPPAGVSVSANGTDWTAGPSSLAVAVATGGNKPVYLEETARVGTAAVNIRIEPWDQVTGTRVGQVGKLTLTPGDTQMTVEWSAVSGATSYDLYHSATNSAPAYGAAPTTAGVTSGVSVTGLTNGEVRYFWVRANAATGAAAWSAVASATAAAYALFDHDFTADGTTFDSAHFGAITSGGGTVTQTADTGVVLNSASVNTKAAALYYLTKLDKTATRTFDWWFKCNSAGDGFTTFEYAYTQATAPSAENTSTILANRRIYPDVAVGSNAIDLFHKNAAGANVADLNTTNAYVVSDALIIMRFENDPNHSGGSSYRVSTIKSDGTRMATSGWILWSDTQSSATDAWTVIGDIGRDVRKTLTTVTRFGVRSTVGS